MSRAIRGNRVSSFVSKTRVPKSKNRSAVLRVISPQNQPRCPATGPRSGPALMRKIAIAPGIEHQERPEDLPVVPTTRDVLGDEPDHRRRLEEPASGQAVRRQPLFEHTP